MIDEKNLWYATVNHGSSDAYSMPPRGPWHGKQAATNALRRWRKRAGALAGTIMAAHSVRLYGYDSRAMARQANISDSPADVLSF